MDVLKAACKGAPIDFRSEDWKKRVYRPVRSYVDNYPIVRMLGVVMWNNIMKTFDQVPYNMVFYYAVVFPDTLDVLVTPRCVNHIPPIESWPSNLLDDCDVARVVSVLMTKLDKIGFNGGGNFKRYGCNVMPCVKCDVLQKQVDEPTEAWQKSEKEISELRGAVKPINTKHKASESTSSMPIDIIWKCLLAISDLPGTELFEAAKWILRDVDANTRAILLTKAANEKYLECALTLLQ